MKMFAAVMLTSKIT